MIYIEVFLNIQINLYEINNLVLVVPKSLHCIHLLLILTIFFLFFSTYNFHVLLFFP